MHNLAHSMHDTPPPPKFHTIPDHLTIMITFPFTDNTATTIIEHTQMIPHLPNTWATFYHPFERITFDCPNSFLKYTRGHIAESKLSSSFCLTEAQMHRIE